MSTPRKHWFKCADSILREPITLEQRGLLVSLQAYLNQRWARDGIEAVDAGRALIPWHDLASITLCDSFEQSVSMLKTGLAWCSITFKVRNRALFVDWPKFAEFQQYESRSRDRVRGDARPETAPSDSGSDSGTQKRTEEKKTEEPARPAASLSSVVLSDVANAFSAYGKHPRAWNAKRLREMTKRAAESGGPENLSRAVHGYAWKHRNPSNGFDPMANFDPETVFSGKFAKYLDAWHEAADAGATPPFQIQPRAPNGSGLSSESVTAHLNALRAQRSQ